MDHINVLYAIRKDQNSIFGDTTFGSQIQPGMTEFGDDYLFEKNTMKTLQEFKHYKYIFEKNNNNWMGRKDIMLSAREVYLGQSHTYLEDPRLVRRSIHTNTKFINPICDIDQEYIQDQIKLCEFTNFVHENRESFEQNYIEDYIQKINPTKQQKEIDANIDLLMVNPSDVDVYLEAKKNLQNNPGFKVIRIDETMTEGFIWNEIVGKKGWRLNLTSENHKVDFIYYYSYIKDHQYVREIVLISNNLYGLENARQFMINLIIKKTKKFKRYCEYNHQNKKFGEHSSKPCYFPYNLANPSMETIIALKTEPQQRIQRQHTYVQKPKRKFGRQRNEEYYKNKYNQNNILSTCNDCDVSDFMCKNCRHDYADRYR